MFTQQMCWYRRKLRLDQYHNSECFFITISCKKGVHHFGRIESGKMKLSAFGKIAEEEWQKLPGRFTNVVPDTVQIMPDHMHGIIFTTGPVAFRKTNAANTTPASPDNAPEPFTQHDISLVIGAYKSCVALSCLRLFRSMNQDSSAEPKLGKIWHRSFYERIVRDDNALQNIRNYILNNPANWKGR